MVVFVAREELVEPIVTLEPLFASRVLLSHSRTAVAMDLAMVPRTAQPVHESAVSSKQWVLRWEGCCTCSTLPVDACCSCTFIPRCLRDQVEKEKINNPSIPRCLREQVEKEKINN